MPSKAKPKAKAPSRAGKARAAKSRPAPKAAAKAKPKPAAKARPKAGPDAKPGPTPSSGSGSRLVEQWIRDLEGWRGETLARMRTLILEADPEMAEDCKWRKPTNPAGVPVWSHDGIVCTGEAYKATVKLTFARGASLPDPSRLFNASLEGGTRRAIDIREGEDVDAVAFKALVRSAVTLNGGGR